MQLSVLYETAQEYIFLSQFLYGYSTAITATPLRYCTKCSTMHLYRMFLVSNTNHLLNGQHHPLNTRQTTANSPTIRLADRQERPQNLKRIEHCQTDESTNSKPSDLPKVTVNQEKISNRESRSTILKPPLLG